MEYVYNLVIKICMGGLDKIEVTHILNYKRQKLSRGKKKT